MATGALARAWCHRSPLIRWIGLEGEHESAAQAVEVGSCVIGCRGQWRRGAHPVRGV